MTSKGNRQGRLNPMRVLGIAIVIAVGLALFPQIMGTYQTMILAYGLLFAMAGLGFNLLLGYTGLLSFGHSAFYGLGAYAVAFAARDLGITSMELLLLCGLGATVALSVVFGLVCVGLTRIFFAIMCLALSQVLWSLSYKFFWVTGGTDGIRVKWPSLLGLTEYSGGGAFQRFVNDYYYYVLVIFCVVVVGMWIIAHSPFGKALQAIRDNETRAEFLGVNIRKYRLISYVVSGSVTGLAGTLWVPLAGLITPDTLWWPFSGKLVFLTLLGGFRNFTGPIVGGVLYNYLEVYAVASTEYWQLVLGGTLVVIIVVLPTGIVGGLSRLMSKLRAKGEPQREPVTDG
ncbi:MAG: branched-chain amino acid ABC transporter permease [Rhodospirillales bacterium]|jgi:branched-chain amino acid transport system permease protein|nr:branched-chain amino acid ABC transporter permease [Rhodospirillales bacterium]